MVKKLLVLWSILSALVLTGAGCAGYSTPAAPTQNNVPAQDQSSVQPAGELPASQPVVSESVVPKSETRQITIANFAFASASVVVKAGTIVKWTNDDQVLHSIKSDNGSFAGSANLNTGDSYEVKFDNPGTYNYACGIHPSMRGQVVVE